MRQIVNKIEQINKFWRTPVTKLDIFLCNKLVNIMVDSKVNYNIDR